MFRVVHEFLDLQDDKYYYHKGDKFPRDGMNVTDERITELSTSANKIGVPLIKEIKRRKSKQKER